VGGRSRLTKTLGLIENEMRSVTTARLSIPSRLRTKVGTMDKFGKPETAIVTHGIRDEEFAEQLKKIVLLVLLVATHYRTGSND